VYSETAQKPITAMYATIALARPSIDTLCVGLQNRLAGYYKALINGSIVTKDIGEDTALPDMREYLTNNFCTPQMLAHGYGNGSELDKQNCRKPCLACNWSSAKAINDAVKSINMGVSGQCKICFNCFRNGYFALLNECKEHGDASVAQVASATSGSAPPASSTDGQATSIETD